jgi:hypothetical protein
MRSQRRALCPDVELLPSSELAPESRLVLAIILRGLLDARQSPAARAWLSSEAYEELCAMVDVPADRLRRLAQAAPHGTLKGVLRSLV